MKRNLLLLTFAAAAALPLLAADHENSAAPTRISHGQKITLADYLVPGKTVVFDFSSEYCGPCRMFAPHLETLDANRDDLIVVTVDINRPEVRGIDWQSPVARQYGLESIPHFKVFGPDGELVAEGDEAYQMVVGWIKG